MAEASGHRPLFSTQSASGRTVYKLFASSMLVSICLVLIYRVSHAPEAGESGRWAWFGMLAAELWFSFYWIITQSVRWYPVYRTTFKDRLSQLEEAELPCVDIFVCTADPAAYFAGSAGASDDKEHSDMKNLFREMESRIDAVSILGKVPKEQKTHKGFSEWTSEMTSKNHQPIVQILIDSREETSVDIDGIVLPTLVYMAREKRPQHHHNFKAGAMNALLRVSSVISNSPIILNADCDMYSNNSQSIRDALCFVMDEQQGHDVAFVQFPQCYENITKNDLYANALKVLSGVEFIGLDGLGGPLYIGTGCFHRRNALCGTKYTTEYKEDWKRRTKMENRETVSILEDRAKSLATCIYELNTQWGKEIGLAYGCVVEDVITGLMIQCRGWRSVYFNPERKGFLGVAPTTLPQTLVQHKRWSEGDLQIVLSKYCPLFYGHGKLKLGHRIGYCIYCLWAPNSIPTLFYLTIPSLFLLKGVSLFPEASSPWFVSFAYVAAAKNAYSLVESLISGDTLVGWWNIQRMWMLKRTTSYLFATIDNMLALVGASKAGFVITAKVAEADDSAKRYEREVMEFGTTASAGVMFVIIGTTALINLACLVVGLQRAVADQAFGGLLMQNVICGLVVALNLPIYEAMFLRKDEGRMSSSTVFASAGLTVLACALPVL
ncbi:cellulose synthase-like protein E6 isoform X4 [Zingiber officinale]|uniref:cellulose synthase-like protein E6 isoform X4 n=1 Tax=Zingiber officinale TaxID=94328 RepID=UPI001C4D04BE|nr:cellulose synthase-like protein E6 isoform X4 [Zingiber officinale]